MYCTASFSATASAVKIEVCTGRFTFKMSTDETADAET